MFTGIVEELGRVVSIDGSRMRFAARTVLADAEPGASIAVNGCCLTVVDRQRQDAPDAPGDGVPAAGWWEADVSPETFARSTMGDLAPGDPVNMERPVRLQDRMGGHLVQGHVDAVGTVRNPAPDLSVGIPGRLVRYVVEKGSVTVDGVSLTVVDAEADHFTAAVIPHTSQVTTLGRRMPGDHVNIEVDVMAKYTERLVRAYLGEERTLAGSTNEPPEAAEEIPDVP